MIELNLDGYTDIPHGKIANIATFLEMREKPVLNAETPANVTLAYQKTPDLERYKAVFKAVGEDWLWFSRLVLDDETLKDIIANPTIEVFFVRQGDRDIGLLELETGELENIELGYFGLVDDAVGKGLGTWLMAQAVARVFDHHRAKRFFVHTCTMDHPKALKFYMKSGFRPYKRAIEVTDDPRLSGHIDKKMGAHHPIIS